MTARGDITRAEALSTPASRPGRRGVTLDVAHLHKPAKEMAAKSGPSRRSGHDHESGNAGLTGSVLPASANLLSGRPASERAGSGRV